ncbi:hypothetical protein [Pseudomonas syringae]|uniref:hypothetical protein n=1 Tax=Pseudomonas syringae TaxID=317 RepID=UPI0004652FAF|nr:hypothetical protein [Pseudomonas syringae]
MSAVHLKPCPYCGRAARYVAEDYVDNSGEPWPFAECDACNTGAPVEFWNKRAQPADQQGEPVAITELRHIFDSNKGADQTLVISKKLAAQLLAEQQATAKVVLPDSFMIVERSIWTEQQVAAATASITLIKNALGMADRDLALAAMDAAQCKAPDISLDEVIKLNSSQP